MPKEENTQQDNKSLDMNKERLIKVGIMSGTIVVLFGLLFLSVFLSRNSWKNGLAETVQKTLDSNSIERTVQEMDLIQSGASSSLVSYSLIQNGKSTTEHGVAVRISTIYGSVPALFIYDTRNQSATFLDLIDVDGIAKESIVASLKSSQLYHWEQRIPKIMKTAKNFNIPSQGDYNE